MTDKTMPALRFRGFYDAWEQRKLGDLGSVEMNKRIFKEETSEIGDVPFYKIGTFGSMPNAFISRKLFQEYKDKYSYPEKGDLLISASGSIGKIVEYKGADEYFQDSNIVWLKHDNRLINSFLKQFYNIVKWQGLEGSTIKRLYNKTILETQINIPHRNEQIKIGSFFKQLDNLITQNEHKVDLLKQLKQAYLQKIFSQELRVAGFKDDWEERKLGELASVLTGFPFKNEDFVANGKYLVITNGNIQNDSSVVDVLLGNRIDDISDEIKERYYLNKNDILVTMDGTVGRTAKVVDDNLILAQRVGRLVSNTNPEFVYQWLNHGSFFNEMTKVSHGGTIKHISLNEISNYRSTVPSNNIEQQKIGAFFKQLDITIDLHQQKLDLLKKQKQAYLQKMFI
ncbi:restriction endonuclease subunit S [Leuconostoc mesenteroides]|uniref:restriction endonuclease subunit S n=1 Tax=Leuconostoc mesenteroides TaxID=1245 RepID=UPI0030D5BB7E